MKRTLATFCLLSMAFCFLLAQKPISDFLNISGHLKSNYYWRDEQDFLKGTPCTMQFVTKLKKPKQGEDSYQVVLVSGDKQFYIPLDKVEEYFEAAVTDRNAFWTMTLLEHYPEAFKKDELASLRHERRLDSDQYLNELEKANLFYDDAALEDYLQCLMLSAVPDNKALERNIGTPIVRLLKSDDPDMMMLGNDVLLISTGMLALLDSEDEMLSLMIRELSHYLMDHALVTIKQNIARANRAAFWGSVLNGVVAATEHTLYERYDYYQPGLLFATNDVIQALVNQKIANRMGMDYSKEFEKEADKIALSYLNMLGKQGNSLASALHKIQTYYQRVEDVGTLSKYGAYGTLEERLKDMGTVENQPVDRDFLKKTMGVVSFEAAMQDYNKQYQNARLLAMKNIDHNLACADDYLMVARSIMRLSNTSESNAECLLYLDKADLVSKVEDINITKMRILLMLRENMMINAVDMVKKYQGQLDVMYQQPHTEEDAEWITAEHLWAEKLLERLYLN